jgi:hypothetical protein
LPHTLQQVGQPSTFKALEEAASIRMHYPIHAHSSEIRDPVPGDVRRFDSETSAIGNPEVPIREENEQRG